MSSSKGSSSSHPSKRITLNENEIIETKKTNSKFEKFYKFETIKGDKKVVTFFQLIIILFRVSF